MYELMIGIPPFYHHNQHKMSKMIRKKKLKFPDLDGMGISVSNEAKDLITKLLSKESENRIGTNGDVEEILSHPWFADLDRKKLMNKEIDPPFVPVVRSNQ